MPSADLSEIGSAAESLFGAAMVSGPFQSAPALKGPQESTVIPSIRGHGLSILGQVGGSR